MEKTLALSLLWVCLSVVAGEKVPVLLWSPNRPLSDLPQSYSGQTVQTSGFQNNYLTPLTSDPKHNLVIFLQDKLSLEDFTNHADVYNPNSDGGAFKNVKAAMDEQFSVHLPSVMKPVVAVDAIIKTFPGSVVRVDNPDELQSLQLADGKSNLIIVTLMPTRGKDEGKAFSSNDEMIGQCLKHLTKRGVQYSALYTAQSSSKVDPAVNSGRRPLSVGGEVYSNIDIYNGSFVNTSEVMVYLRNIVLNLTPKESTKLSTVFYSETLDINDTSVINETTTMLVMKLSNENASMELIMETNIVNHTLDWNVTSTTLTLTSRDPKWKNISGKPISFDFEKDIISQLNFSYHCTKLPGYYFDLSNDTAEYLVDIELNGFQYQPYVTNTTNKFFADPMDCVEFFTTPIWMGLLSTLILAMILFYGMTMISNITTMDRFDDPKGKTITVTVNE